MQFLTLPRNALILRQELCKLLEKGAIKQLPASKLEYRLSSCYFEEPERDGELRPILHLRPINRALCKRPLGTILLEQILAQIHPGTGCVHGFKERVLSHSDSTASHAFSHVCSRGHSVPVPCSPVWAGFVPVHFLEVHGGGSFPHSERAEYLDEWLILAQSWDTPAIYTNCFVTNRALEAMWKWICVRAFSPRVSL